MLAHLRPQRFQRLIRVLVGILEEGERRAIRQRIEGMAVVDLAADRAVIGALAPSAVSGMPMTSSQNLRFASWSLTTKA